MSIPWQAVELSWPVDVVATVRRFAADRDLAWLDTAASDDAQPRHARYSLIALDPLAVLEQPAAGPATLRSGNYLLAEASDGWRLWQATHRRLPRMALLPFDLSPGWVGYVGYEMVELLENVPPRRSDPHGLPRMRMGLFDRGVVLDHRERRVFATYARGLAESIGLPERSAGADAEIDAWLDRWETCAADRLVPSMPAPGRVSADVERAVFERLVARAREYIAAGDVYQVNLSQRLRLEQIPEALAAYAEIRRLNPEAYAALLRWDSAAIASASPELFLSLRDGEVLTRPIKGTRPRTHDIETDEAAVAELLTSRKDEAELAMIVDLHRNDLGRVCQPASVRVAHARRVEAHPSVFHTVADVVGRLSPERDAIDLLRACFPAGSVTGVPKIRALQVINELEPVARGVYTGAIGTVGLDGQANFSVAIRTLQICGQTAELHVGGGIVADSDPAGEYEETLAKADAIIRALGHRDGVRGALRGGVGVH